MTFLRLIYSDKQVNKICENFKEALIYFGGNKKYAISLHARINALRQAENIKDIIAQKQMRFHKLSNKGKEKNLEGYFAIDVKTIKDKWRIIIEPLDENEKSYKQSNIDEIAKHVRIIKIKEVSNHYE